MRKENWVYKWKLWNRDVRVQRYLEITNVFFFPTHSILVSATGNFTRFIETTMENDSLKMQVN